MTRTGPTVTRVRAASHEALVAAVTRKTESLKRSSSGEHVLVVYDADAARVYVEARTLAPTLAQRAQPRPKVEVRS